MKQTSKEVCFAFKEQKLLPQFLKFILFTLFFVQKKSAAKEVKKPSRLYRLYQCRYKAERARLSSLVIFARTSQKFGGTTRRGNASQIRYALQTRYRREELLL